jgi:hypothetical protein
MGIGSISRGGENNHMTNHDYRNIAYTPSVSEVNLNCGETTYLGASLCDMNASN